MCTTLCNRQSVYIVPLRLEREALQEIKQFAKTIVASDALIYDVARAQKSAAVRRFCNDISNTLGLLEESTPWSNKTKLYISIIKKSVRKYMKSSNYPLAFWDYFLECRARINNLPAKDFFSLHGSNALISLIGEEEIYQPSANLIGTTSVIIGKRKSSFSLINKSWDEYSYPL